MKKMNWLTPVKPKSVPERKQFKQWQIDWIRRRGSRNLKLTIKGSDCLRVVTPWRFSWEKALHFINENEPWILEQQQKLVEHNKNAWQPAFKVGETFHLLGEQLIFSIVPTTTKKIFFSRSNGKIYLHLPEKSFERSLNNEQVASLDLTKKLKKFYRSQAEILLVDRLELWAVQMNLPYKTVTFRSQKTRWGSCSSLGSISLNWKMVIAPLEVIDSILIHELAHLQHMNHSKKFWQLVELFAPTHKESTRWLRKHHHLFAWLE
jgi:predicted metal-dependent hydrolase